MQTAFLTVNLTMTLTSGVALMYVSVVVPSLELLSTNTHTHTHTHTFLWFSSVRIPQNISVGRIPSRNIETQAHTHLVDVQGGKVVGSHKIQRFVELRLRLTFTHIGWGLGLCLTFTHIGYV